MTQANGGMTPLQKLTRRKPKLNHLRVWGCETFVHNPKQGKNKLQSHSERCLLIGYNEQSKVYQVFNPNNRNVEITKDVKLNEGSFGLQQNIEKQNIKVQMLVNSSLRKFKVRLA